VNDVSARGLEDVHAADSAMLDPTIAVVIVTYDSGQVLGMCLEALAAQTRRPNLIVIVDNRSADPSYLEVVPDDPQFRLIRSTRNDGFCGGNNRGYALAQRCKYVLFLNPDAFLSTRFIEEALEWMEQPESARVGCVTGALLSFDVVHRQPTGRIDSTGIFQTWYGRWFDRGRDAAWNEASERGPREDITAACGALMFCRTEALEEVVLRRGEIFDSRFFMYKEDIDLSLRLSARGWRVVYSPSLICYHGRGWKDRTRVSFWARLLSVRNELRVCWRYRRTGLPFSLLKYAFVLIVERPLFGLLRNGGQEENAPKPEGPPQYRGNT
jgi:N-acetylglucosaminyl-diphospho-decaprenol L-rhamnosyltransferase